MRKFLLLFISVLFLGQTFGTTPVELPKHAWNANNIIFTAGTTGQKISLMELARISIKDFELLRGKKMKFLDRLTFKVEQKKLRDNINSDGTLNNKKIEKAFKQRAGETGFHFGGFALGFFLGIIGVLIAYLIKDDFKHNRVKWAWIGFGIQAVLGLISIASGL